MMKYYRSKHTGKIFNQKISKIIDMIYGKGSFEYDVSNGNMVEIEPPSLVDCIMFGNNSLAIARYLEIYPGTEWEDGKRAIHILRKEVFGNRKKKTENVEKTEE